METDWILQQKGRVNMTQTDWEREKIIQGVVQTMCLSEDRAMQLYMEEFLTGFLLGSLETKIPSIRLVMFDESLGLSFDEACKEFEVEGKFKEELRKMLLEGQDRWTPELVKAYRDYKIQSDNLIERAEKKAREYLEKLEDLPEELPAEEN